MIPWYGKHIWGRLSVVMNLTDVMVAARRGRAMSRLRLYLTGMRITGGANRNCLTYHVLDSTKTGKLNRNEYKKLRK